ncbi:MAG: GHKL domain-containing protein [Clostridiaceae bacterium]|nr:GHKL domain-containing protein [Clostridiaceae bacterium]
MPKAKGKKLSTGIWLIKWKRNKERVFFGHPPRKDDFMFANIIEFCRYWFVLLFGTTVAVSFAGLERTKKNILAIGIMTNALFILQLIALLLFGFDNVLKLYPVLSHIPLVFFIVFYMKRSWVFSVTCIAVSYLCSQLPRWVGSVANALTQSVTANHITYIIAAFIIYYYLYKYVFESFRPLIERSEKTCLLLGAMPVLYYIFEYISGVYTDFLYTGSRVAIQFMPFVSASFYLIFALLYYEEMKRKAAIQREKDMLDTRFRQARTEFESLKQMQQNAAAYRHDMRHHLALLQGLASKGRIEEIKEYLKVAQADLDAITPTRYCENETVNLILSSFAAKAKQSDIRLSIDAKLPEALPFSETELCSLLSNALENAINACSLFAESDRRLINLRLYSKNNKLCMDIQNSYKIEPVFDQGLPVSKEEGHGYGTKSMACIVEKYGGICRFTVKDGLFIFQATI